MRCAGPRYPPTCYPPRPVRAANGPRLVDDRRGHAARGIRPSAHGRPRAPWPPRPADLWWTPGLVPPGNRRRPGSSPYSMPAAGPALAPSRSIWILVPPMRSRSKRERWWRTPSWSACTSPISPRSRPGAPTCAGAGRRITSATKAPLTLELGCGQGLFAVDLARRFAGSQPRRRGREGAPLLARSAARHRRGRAQRRLPARASSGWIGSSDPARSRRSGSRSRTPSSPTSAGPSVSCRRSTCASTSTSWRSAASCA